MSNLNAGASNCVRVRFAPSPTGFLHIGGVRAALFNWLFARGRQGKFLLRIEDTDLERSEERFTQDFLESLKWLGLTWDEEPLFQSKRLDLYRQKAEELVQKGHAYYCCCTEQQVEAMRENAIKEGKKPQYDRRCRDRIESPTGRPFVIRAKIPLEGFVEFEDLIRGPIRISNQEMDDFVLIRSNGAPTYNLSVVVDDVLSKMTHILRGDDHINNTPKQVHLYRFFEYPIPKFAHLPMILGQDKKKLSKRHGAVSANAYRAEGYLPEALLNFLARLGWSHGDQEIFSIEELIQLFSFDSVQKSSAVFNGEKLLWLNGAHIRATKSERLVQIIVDDFSSYFSPEQLLRVQTQLGVQLVSLIQPKVKLVKELAEQLVPLCSLGVIPVDAAGLKWGKDGSLKQAIQLVVKQATESLSAKIQGTVCERKGPDVIWGPSPSLGDAGMNHSDVNVLFRQLSEQHGVKLGELMQPIRLAMTGGIANAGLFELLVLLPWEVVESRLKQVGSF